jgi:hypothetical protein
MGPDRGKQEDQEMNSFAGQVSLVKKKDGSLGYQYNWHAISQSTMGGLAILVSTYLTRMSPQDKRLFCCCVAIRAMEENPEPVVDLLKIAEPQMFNLINYLLECNTMQHSRPIYRTPEVHDTQPEIERPTKITPAVISRVIKPTEEGIDMFPIDELPEEGSQEESDLEIEERRLNEILNRL